jgi:hypothetical protein
MTVTLVHPEGVDRVDVRHPADSTWMADRVTHRPPVWRRPAG